VKISVKNVLAELQQPGKTARKNDKDETVRKKQLGQDMNLYKFDTNHHTARKDFLYSLQFKKKAIYSLYVPMLLKDGHVRLVPLKADNCFLFLRKQMD
jgi:hypothetical protein